MRRLKKGTISLVDEETLMHYFVCHRCGCTFDMPKQLVPNIVVCPDCKRSAPNKEIADSFMTDEEWALEIATVRAKIADHKGDL